MDQRSARSSRRATSAKGRRSMSAGSAKSGRSRTTAGRKSNASMMQKTQDDITMGNMETADDMEPLNEGNHVKTYIKPHDIYRNTQTIPNKELRLLNIAINPSLFFQMVLFYHSTFDILFVLIMFPTALYRLQIQNQIIPWDIVVLVLLIIWLPIELTRMSFGYRGNIEELFPELLAFWIFSVFFTLPLSISMWPWNRDFIFPHERMTIGIHLVFVIGEILLGIKACREAKMKTRTSFHLRTAPLVDRMFIKKQRNSKDVNAIREIELGVQGYDATVEATKNPFKLSDDRVNNLRGVRGMDDFQ